MQKIGEILFALGYEIPQRHCAKKAKIKSHLWRVGKHMSHQTKKRFISACSQYIAKNVHATNEIQTNKMWAQN